MAKQAKISLIADVSELNQAVKQAKQVLQDLGNVKVSDQFAKELKDALSQDLIGMMRASRKEVRAIKEDLKQVSDASNAAFDTAKIADYLKKLAEAQEKLKNIRGMYRELNSKPMPEAPGKGGGNAPSPISLSKIGGLATGALGTLGLAVGVGSLFQRQRQISRERLEYLPLTGGATGDDRASRFGFNPEERRARFLEIARASGRDMTDNELNSMADQGEMAQRAYGVSSQQQGDLMGAARRAGMDSTKVLSNSIGAAVAAGLEGSKIGEYLSAMRESIESMSDGIDISGASLNGFAAELSSLPFFSNDPRRSFQAAQSLNNTFQNGDRFQQAMSARAIVRAAGSQNATAASVDFRRGMGLFGQVDEATMKDLKKIDPRLAKTLGTSPDQIIDNIFKDTMELGKDLNPDQQLNAFQKQTGLSHGAAMSIWSTKKLGKALTKEQKEQLKNSQMTPEERMEKTFKNFDGSIAKTGAKIEGAMDGMAADVGAAIVTLDEALGMNTDELKTLGEIMMALTAAIAVKGGLEALGGLKGLKDAASAGVKSGGLMRGVSAGVALYGAGAAAGNLENAYDYMQNPEQFEEEFGERVKGRGFMGRVLNPGDTLTEIGMGFGTMINGDSALQAKEQAGVARHESRHSKWFKEQYGYTPEEAKTWRKRGLDPKQMAKKRGSLPESAPIDVRTTHAATSEERRKAEASRADERRTKKSDTKDSAKDDLSQVTSENTRATRELTAALTKRANMERRPSNASMIDNSKVGM